MECTTEWSMTSICHSATCVPHTGLNIFQPVRPVQRARILVLYIKCGPEEVSVLMNK